ncbi:hypothetical protein DEU56DRAFT_762003 [Suillus clintonianus]|uniref:uncharacterized protein n=1 Tax=Suillus clintonianus TaxID=1904413 RepID=UPI001B862C04|nr:uncharacterized protein DEU56DRAFT_762003 [Suillus clintonianus]KAG2112865.1 hypothetical protein DEU56DRAFT_762003 [Suillus clintonianus]
MSCPSTPARQPHFYTDPTSGLRRSPRKMCPEGLSFIPSQNGTPQNHDHRWNNHGHTIFSLPSNFSDQGHILSSGDGENDIPEAPTMPTVTPAKTPVRRIRARAAPKTPGSATPVPKPKSMRGTGSKSGEGNRRTSGNSDDEISKLAESQLGRAGLKLEPEGLGAAPVETPVKLEGATSGRAFSDEDKLKAVKYITSPEVWPTFKLTQTTTFTYIACVLLKGRVDHAQIRNFWHNQAWPKYKAVRERQEHTGGGDGDEDGEGDELDGECGNIVEDDVALDGTKRKRTSKKKVSKKVLDEFEASEIFRAIDAVHDINSSESISDDETPPKKRMHKSASFEANDISDTSTLLRDMMGTMGERHRRQAKVDETNLEVAKLNMEVTLKQ